MHDERRHCVRASLPSQATVAQGADTGQEKQKPSAENAGTTACHDPHKTGFC
jgi:hypothetical protein